MCKIALKVLGLVEPWESRLHGGKRSHLQHIWSPEGCSCDTSRLICLKGARVVEGSKESRKTITWVMIQIQPNAYDLLWQGVAKWVNKFTLEPQVRGKQV